MALEDLTGTKYIDDLNASNPAAGDNVSEGDDHIRGIKNVLKVTLPNVTGAVTPTHTELNYVDGVTSAIQTQLNAVTANDWVTTARINADAITGSEIADNAIDSEHYADGSIDNAHIADNAIDSEHYTDGSIDLAHLSADCVDATKIADDAINSEHYTDGSIDLAHLAADCVDGTKIADDACNSEHYTNGSIDTAHIADLNVTGAKLALDHRSANSTDDVKTGNQHDYIFFDADVGISFFSANAEDMRLTDAGALHVDGDIVAFSSTISDEALKYDINPIDHALDKINTLKGVTYKYLKDGMESAGLLAQDVEKVLPCAVQERELPLHTGNNKLFKTLNYDNLHALLIESIKELTAKVEKLEKK